MWTQTNTLLLLTCCLWAAEAQNDNGNGNARANGNGAATAAAAETRKSVWEDPIQFHTKAQDLCTMIVTGQGDFTRLRIQCQNGESSYWCEYMGKPQVCRSYNNNPRHYFTQVMWELRKQQNACQAPKAIKPQMCKRAPEESQMVWSASSTPEAAAPAPKPERPQEKQPAPAKPDTPKAPVTKQAKPAAAKPEQTKPAKPEVAKVEQAKPEQAKPAKPEQVKPEQARPDQAKPEAKPAPTKAVQPKPEQPKPEQPRPAPARPAVAKPEQAKPDQEAGKPVVVKSAKPGVKTTALRKMLTPKPAPPKPTKPAVKSSPKKMAQEYCWRSMQGICAYVIGWFQN